MEPIISQFFSVMFGNDQWPGWMSFAGAIIVTISINVMKRGENKRAKIESEKKSQEIQMKSVEETNSE